MVDAVAPIMAVLLMSAGIAGIALSVAMILKGSRD